MYGVIDIGSNTVRLNIYHVYENGFKKILSNKEPAGLASYIEDGAMTEEGIKIASFILEDMKSICKALNINNILAFATAPLRNISNPTEAKEAIEKNTGLEIRVLSGDEEASLSYRGAIYDVQLKDGLAVDIGGGSTELVFFEDEAIKDLASLDMGSLTMFNKYVEKIIPEEKELEKIKKKTTSKLKDLDIKVKDKLDIIGVGGTLRAALRVNNYIHKHPDDYNKITKDELASLIASLKSDYDHTKSIILKVEPRRVHTILPGLKILSAIADRYESPNIYVSEFGVREGYLASYLEDKNVLNAENNTILDIKMIFENEVSSKISKHAKKNEDA